jgi:hypothetical protein
MKIDRSKRKREEAKSQEGEATRERDKEILKPEGRERQRGGKPEGRERGTGKRKRKREARGKRKPEGSKR